MFHLFSKVRCKLLFPMLFQRYVATYVANFCPQCFICFSYVCCKCVYLDVAYVFTHMLQVFYLDVVYVLQWFFKCFMCFFVSASTYVSNISSVFRLMLQVLCLNISKINWVLHLSADILLPYLGVSSSPPAALHHS
jgi:hypothetical protein